MYAQTQYGQILQDEHFATGGAVDIDHNLDDDDFCVFAIQDCTNSGLVNASASLRLWAADTDAPAKTRTAQRMGDVASQFQLEDATAAREDELYVTILLAAAHSKLDVGPVVLGTDANPTADRTAATFWPRAGRVPSYRSLHRRVTFDLTAFVGHTVATADVTHMLGHTLGGAAVHPLVFIHPIEDPYDAGYGGSVIRFAYHSVVDADTTKICCFREDGGAFGGDGKESIKVDVMFLCKPELGYSGFCCNTWPLASGSSGDYAGGDRPQGPHRPTYETKYYNVDGLASGLDVDIEHDLQNYAQICLIGLDYDSVLPTLPTNATPYIEDRYPANLGATAITHIRMNNVKTAPPGVTTFNNNHAVICRTWSPVLIGEDNIVA